MACPRFTDSYIYDLFVDFCLTFQLLCLNVNALYVLICHVNGSTLSTNDPSKLFKLCFLLWASKVM